ncbi:MAG: SirB2 family protein [Arhodomonas sp.]|nr:SirB2 family protein [Arhodomonas sp.]
MALKHIHLTTVVVLRIALFLLRGYWMFAGSSMLQRRWVRIAPHVNDTVLLVSALWLAVSVSPCPDRLPRLDHRRDLLALIVYIVLGTIALKRGSTMAARGRGVRCRPGGIRL